MCRNPVAGGFTVSRLGAYEDLRAELSLAGPASEADLICLRHDYGKQVPGDYLALVSAHDGRVGPAGRLHPAAEVGRGHELYADSCHLSELVIFGSDGGGGPSRSSPTVAWSSSPGPATPATPSRREHSPTSCPGSSMAGCSNVTPDCHFARPLEPDRLPAALCLMAAPEGRRTAPDGVAFNDSINEAQLSLRTGNPMAV